MSRLFVLLVSLSVVAGTTANTCEVTGAPWVIPAKTMKENLYPAVATGPESFNVSFHIRHGAGVCEGKLLGNNKVEITISATETCMGTFDDTTCNTINWTSSSTNKNGCFALSWCRAWTPGCVSPPPPYGQGFSFLSTFGSNMVLQQGPAISAVYGIMVGSPTSVTVTVVDEADGSSYDVNATFNSTHQAVGPEFVGNPITAYQSWKAFLKPTTFGGNYTIKAACIGCTLDGSFSDVNISNVTFGDVWHCSGQSNMWLPVMNSFSQNETLGNISMGKYSNIRVMAGNSASGTSNPWMTASQAAVVPPQQGRTPPVAPLLEFGAACWYFAQKLTDELEAVGKVVPLGLSDTAIGGQRIEEYMVNDSTLVACSERTGETSPEWNGRLFGQQTIPFVDMTIKGWVWYQGENNMGGTKGNAIANIGYSCEQRALVRGWRKIWSETPGTTDALAPFGIVTLASSGSEGGADIGAMRWAQTASHGVLPNPDLPNTFLAQAFDLDDKWGPGAGPCQSQTQWACCTYDWGLAGKCTYNKTSCDGHEEVCAPACASTLTRSVMGGIHPRWKKPVGDRLGTAAFNSVYGGKGAFTGPTLSSCTVGGGSGSGPTMTIAFNTSLLAGDTLEIGKIPPPSSVAVSEGLFFERLGKGEMASSGSQLYVQINTTLFCVEKQPALNSTGGSLGYDYCPTWAGGDGSKGDPTIALDTQWIMLNYTKASGSSITVDLSPLNGSTPTAVQYAWGVVDCCDHSDPDLYISQPCGLCPIMSSSNLPANPFKAKIVGGKCECVAPQVCSGDAE